MGRNCALNQVVTQKRGQQLYSKKFHQLSRQDFGLTVYKVFSAQSPHWAAIIY
jgi:hypothetical protein